MGNRGANRTVVNIGGLNTDKVADVVGGALSMGTGSIGNPVTGDGWILTDYLADLDIGTPRVLIVRAGSNTDIGAAIAVTASAAVKLDVYEGPSYSVMGTALTPRNTNRNATTTPHVQVTHTPTVASDGTLLLSTISASIADSSFVLKAGTAYLIRVTAIADNTVASIVLRFRDDLSGAVATSTTTTTTTAG